MMQMKLTTAGIVAATLTLGACTDPATVGTPGSNTQKGAVLGGIIGAGVGAIANDSDRGLGAVTGALVGATAGSVIGNQLDAQERELRQNLSNDDITIVNTGDRLILSFPNDLTFATDSAAVSPAVQGDLRRVANSLVRYPNSTIQVIGHTDSDGDAGYNQGLSERRANAVASEIAAGGVPYHRMRIIGRGEEQPVASNLTPEGKARNRRVEVVVIPQAA
ncbi:MULTISPECIES: OmpA family protein [unclassified Leisingera]|uniref:OmpA family protein n=1 Tax=unclassified Leisingera TaxID=2614906 RepID=UPI0002ECB5EC|nr:MULTISPECIES: OmpA family protein [unclassified Leisingera]KIC16580.1 membrane protein [Leisingera sp. ANG-DT]KIC24738.1 membrane protein [Leisingera sp. ANG-S3]KIC28482.1 membrane protein [Leisingera sp. ANG-M6]KIC31610.1 membrane protein [Leisingera sp. ANG-S5]KIC55406.1 membrane protein [Leisingera sp. ANG-S]